MQPVIIDLVCNVVHASPALGKLPRCPAEVYERVAARAPKNILDGYNGCILAYGATGAGKTCNRPPNPVQSYTLESE